MSSPLMTGPVLVPAVTPATVGKEQGHDLLAGIESEDERELSPTCHGRPRASRFRTRPVLRA